MNGFVWSHDVPGNKAKRIVLVICRNCDQAFVYSSQVGLVNSSLVFREPLIPCLCPKITSVNYNVCICSVKVRADIVRDEVTCNIGFLARQFFKNILKMLLCNAQ